MRDTEGEYHALTGNMSGCLLADYIIGQRKATGKLPDDGFLVTTIVSTNLAQAIAADYGVDFVEVLTGFKYIGEKILISEETGKGHYQFGFEESYGSLAGEYARDKDAVAGSLSLCEAAAWYKTQGKTLWEAMTGLYEKHGWYQDGVKAVAHEGAQGLELIAAMMEALRNDPPKKLGSWDVVAMRDYRSHIRKVFDPESEETLDLPKSNVLYFELTDQAWVCVRPSGTEPKIKFYFGVRGESEDASKKALEELTNAVDSYMDGIQSRI